jgi:hypothetical protein
MVTETKVFQFSEVQTHGSFTDCWLIIHGKVGSIVHHHHQPPKRKFSQVFLPNTCMYVPWIVCLVFFMLGFCFWGLSQVVIFQ